MRFREWFRPPRQMVVVFFLAALASTAALGWLTWELLARDEADERNRRVEDRERAADTAVLAIDRQLVEMERRLTRDAASPDKPGDALPAGFVVVGYAAGEFSVRPSGSLPYFPAAGFRTARVVDAFREAERQEFIETDYERAARTYSALAASDDASTRATALARLGRVHRKQQKWTAALNAYDRLETAANVGVEGMPAVLVARLGRISLFETEQPDAGRLRDEAMRLKADLEQGRLRLTKSQYTQWADEVRRMTGGGPSLDIDAHVRSDALEWLWARRSDAPSAGTARRVVSVAGGAALVSWRFDHERLSAIVAGPRAIAALVSGAVPKGFAWSLTDFEGRLVAGDQPSSRDVASRTGPATGFPWTLHLFPAAESPAPASTRRILLVSVLISVAGILVAAWYFIWRGVSREARVARLQSDFVAAVSHEFRSPLTSMRHIAELLATDRMVSDERRQRSYALLVAETDRMGRLVEGLLDFGRMQDGRTQFTFEEVDLRDLASEVVADFSRRLSPDGHRIDLAAGSATPATRADREAIGRVIWNLLDNAVKYSPDARSIRVEVTSDASRERVSVSVRDEGLGIPRGEHQHIFERFVRGAEATSRRIGGTGIGLAMAREIVRAHGGDIMVASELGKGSTFTVALPVAGGPS